MTTIKHHVFRVYIYIHMFRQSVISDGSECRYPELQVLESWDMASVCVCVHIQIQSPLAFFVHALRYVVWLFAFVEFRFRMLNHGLAMIYIDKHYGNPT